MKLRIKFSKHGPVRFIGHLDVMRYFQKAMRRADVDIRYSEGYSPHQVMSFASPLGLGLTSSGEYMDIEVNSLESCEALVNQLNEVMSEGIRILSCRVLDEHAKNAMSLVAAADYTLEFREGKAPEMDGFFDRIPDFLSQEEILVMKKSKKGERETDIRPMIYDLHEDDGKIYIKAAAGSTDNVKPELIMKAYFHFQNLVCPEYAFFIERNEIYTCVTDETGCEKLIPLLEAGAIGE